jgi:alpha-1,3-glucosyltransferase
MQEMRRVIMVFAVLCPPSLMVIDYGHFQYNSVSLGLTLWGIVAVISGWEVTGSVAFSLAINYKQMELYHSLPFFFYLLGKAKISTAGKTGFVLAVLKLGVAVVLVFGVCWLPFYVTGGSEGIRAVVARIFPVGRGVYEDKVASFWCSLSVLLKVREVLSTTTLLWASIVLTLMPVLPSMVGLVRNPTPYRFLLSLVSLRNTALISKY